MRKTLLVAVLLGAVAPGASGQVIPTDVPPVKLFEELNYELPELAKVKAAVDGGDMAAAKTALLDHFRARKDAQSRPKHNPDYNTHIADNILVGKFIFPDWANNVVCTYGPKIEDIQWYRIPKEIKHWNSFQNQIVRQAFVTTLTDAYRNTGDEKYVRHMVALMLKFIKDCPVEDARRMPFYNNTGCLAERELGMDGLQTKGHPGVMWCFMATGRRIQCWPHMLNYCIHAEAMTPDALATILTSLVEQQRYLVDAMEVCKQGNHCTRMPTVALELAAKLPEFKERDQWADRAITELLRRYNWYGPDRPDAFVYRDGATVEICPDVASGDYGTLLSAIRWTEMAGREVPRQFIEVRDKMAEYLNHVRLPNQIKKGETPPEYISYPMRSGDPCYGGTYFMRSAWTPDAVVLRVRFGPIQYKYSQYGLGDVGDVGVWGYGMLLVPHLYNHPSKGPFAAYGDRSFQGHGRSENTISVDGVGQSKANRVRYIDRPLDNPWVTTPVFDYVRGSYQFDQKRVKASHTRAIMFVKPDYFVIIDRIDGDGKSHEYRMKYQLHHDLTAEADGVKVLGSKAGTPRVVVVPSRDDLKLSIVKGRKEPFYEGWHLHAPDKAAPAPAVIYRWREKSPARVETVIWPVAPGTPASIGLTRQVADGVVTLTVRQGECVDVISCGKADEVKLTRSVGGRIVATASSQRQHRTVPLGTPRNSTSRKR